MPVLCVVWLSGCTSGERTGMLTSSPTVPADFSDQLSAVNSHTGPHLPDGAWRECVAVGYQSPCALLCHAGTEGLTCAGEVTVAITGTVTSHPNSNWSCVVTASDKLSSSSALYLVESIVLTFFTKMFRISGRFICIIIMNSDLGRTSWTNEQV